MQLLINRMHAVLSLCMLIGRHLGLRTEMICEEGVGGGRGGRMPSAPPFHTIGHVVFVIAGSVNWFGRCLATPRSMAIDHRESISRLRSTFYLQNSVIKYTTDIEAFDDIIGLIILTATISTLPPIFFHFSRLSPCYGKKYIESQR